MGFHSTFRVLDEYFTSGITETPSTLGSSVKPAHNRNKEESIIVKTAYMCVMRHKRLQLNMHWLPFMQHNLHLCMTLVNQSLRRHIVIMKE